MLSRSSARSLKAFLDEASEVMQFHIRKLYTAEGRRVRRFFFKLVYCILGCYLQCDSVETFPDQQCTKPDDLSRGVSVRWAGIL